MTSRHEGSPAMLWVCTDWELDWNAIAAISTAGAVIVALALATSEAWRRSAERRSRARLLAQWMSPHVLELEGALRAALVAFGRPREEKDPNVYGITEAGFDRELARTRDFNRTFNPYLPYLDIPEIERVGLDFGCFPSHAVTRICGLRLSLSYLRRSMREVGTNVEREDVRDAMIKLRSELDTALRDAIDVKVDVITIARVPTLRRHAHGLLWKFNKWRVRRMNLAVDP